MNQRYTNGRHRPYVLALRAPAKTLRNDATPAERRLWFGFLRGRRPQWYRQRPLDRFIVDFYCPALRLVVEVDGPSHDGADAVIRDAERTHILRAHGLRVVRLTNAAVLHRFPDACAWLTDRMAEQQRPAQQRTTA